MYSTFATTGGTGWIAKLPGHYRNGLYRRWWNRTWAHLGTSRLRKCNRRCNWKGCDCWGKTNFFKHLDSWHWQEETNCHGRQFRQPFQSNLRRLKAYKAAIGFNCSRPNQSYKLAAKVNAPNLLLHCADQSGSRCQALRIRPTLEPKSFCTPQ